MYKVFFVVALLLITVTPYFIKEPKVLGAQTNSVGAEPILAYESTISAKTSFNLKTLTLTEDIPFTTNYRDDPSMEYGEEKVIEPGENGAIKTSYLITYWEQGEIDREKTGVEKVPAKVQLVAKGTKVVWRTLETESGKIKYWRKIKVWATKYDGNCYGCRGLTYSGTKVQKGVCAVDPKVITLGTNFYVEGYGMCRSEDIGGGIKGNEVDLGFEDASNAPWGAAYTNVYLMTSAPQ